MNRTKVVLSAQIQELLDCEQQLLTEIPYLARASGDAELAEVLLDHHAETEKHIGRLKEICELLKIDPTAIPCQVVRTLLEDAKKKSMAADPAERDAWLVLIMHRIEQFEIASYNTAAVYAEILAEDQVAEILAATLDEEALASDTLTDIATYPEDEECKDAEYNSTRSP